MPVSRFTFRAGRAAVFLAAVLCAESPARPPEASPPSRGVVVRWLDHLTGPEGHVGILRSAKRYGAGAVPALADLLRHKNPGARHRAAEALAFVGPAGKWALPALTKAIHDSDDDVADRALHTILELGGSVPVTDCLRLLGSNGEEARDRAMKGLRHLGPGASAAVKPLIDHLRGGKTNPTDVARVLGSIGPAAFPEVAKLVEARDEVTRQRGILALGFMEDVPKAVPALTALLGDKSDAIRLSSIEALGRIGAGAKDASPTLLKVLREDKGEVRRAAVYALAKIGTNRPAVIAVLIADLSDENRDVRLKAVRALGGFGPEAKAATTALIHVLSENDDRIHINEDVIKALLQIHPKPKK